MEITRMSDIGASRPGDVEVVRIYNAKAFMPANCPFAEGYRKIAVVEVRQPGENWPVYITPRHRNVQRVLTWNRVNLGRAGYTGRSRAAVAMREALALAASIHRQRNAELVEVAMTAAMGERSPAEEL